MSRKHRGDDDRKLVKAVAVGNVKVVRELLKAGVIPDAETLEEAWDDKPRAIITLLLEAGAPCEKMLREKFHELEHIYTRRRGGRRGQQPEKPHPERWRFEALLDHADLNKIRPSLLFSCRWDPVVTKMLLDRGADPNVTDNYGMNPLAYALDFACEEIINYLLDAGASCSWTINQTFLHQKREQSTALHIAVEKNLTLATFARLLRSGVDVNAMTGTLTALSIAVAKGEQYVRPLLEAGADPDLGKPTPLEQAFLYNRSKAVAALLEYGAVLNVNTCWNGVINPRQLERIALLHVFGSPMPAMLMAKIIEAHNWPKDKFDELLRAQLPLKSQKLV